MTAFIFVVAGAHRRPRLLRSKPRNSSKIASRRFSATADAVVHEVAAKRRREAGRSPPASGQLEPVPELGVGTFAAPGPVEHDLGDEPTAAGASGQSLAFVLGPLDGLHRDGKSAAVELRSEQLV